MEKVTTLLKDGMVIRNKDIGEGLWLVTSVVERQPQLTIGNRISSYENEITVIEVDENYQYDENHMKKKIFSTAFVYNGAIPEDQIEIVKQLVLKYVDPDIGKISKKDIQQCSSCSREIKENESYYVDVNTGNDICNSCRFNC
jgi:hypothetical protein